MQRSAFETVSNLSNVSNVVAVFSHEQFGEIRTVLLDGEPWFVAADVCRALEIKNNRDAIARLDDDEKGVALTDTPGGMQEVSVVSEAGLYSLVLGSRKPEAKLFKRWVTHDVIPAIRKTGMYSVKTLSPAELLLEQAKMLVEQERRMTAVESKVDSVENNVLAMKTQVNDLETKFEAKLNPTVGMDWYTITGYIALNKYRINPNDYAMLGRAAARLSREKGYPIGQAPHPSYGHVGVYNSDILSEVFKCYEGKW